MPTSSRTRPARTTPTRGRIRCWRWSSRSRPSCRPGSEPDTWGIYWMADREGTPLVDVARQFGKTYAAAFVARKRVQEPAPGRGPEGPGRARRSRDDGGTPMTSPCPSPDTLARFAHSGRWPGRRSDAWSRTWRECPACRDRLEQRTRLTPVPTLATWPDEGRAPPAIPGYEDVEELGRGGMGVVYRGPATGARPGRGAEDAPARAGATPTEVAPLPRRGRGGGAAATTRNIVPVYEVGEHDGQPYFVMEFVDGGDAGRPAGRRAAAAARGAPPLVATVGRAVARRPRPAASSTATSSRRTSCSTARRPTPARSPTSAWPSGSTTADAA